MTKTERQIKSIYWTVTENQKRNVQKVELFVLLSWLFYRVCVFVDKQPPQSAYRVKYFRVWGGFFDLSRFIETKWVKKLKLQNISRKGISRGGDPV